MSTGISHTLDMLKNLQYSMDRARTSNWQGRLTGGSGAYPPVNVFGEGEAVVVVAELPGVSKEDVQVEVKKDRLRIFGTKGIDYPEAASLHRRERATGSFDRTFTLPFEIEADSVKARHEFGILAIRLEPAEADKPRSITVQ